MSTTVITNDNDNNDRKPETTERRKRSRCARVTSRLCDCDVIVTSVALLGDVPPVVGLLAAHPAQQGARQQQRDDLRRRPTTTTTTSRDCTLGQSAIRRYRVQ